MDVIQGDHQPRTYMDQSPILVAIDLSPVQPQSSSQQLLTEQETLCNKIYILIEPTLEINAKT